jgi:CheY-like chemotaxis protein
MGLRLLIVDDNADAAESLGKLLTAHKFEVAVAHGGMAAVELAGTFNRDVFILDLSMPGMDGYQLARTLRTTSEFAHKHYVALTAHSDQAHMDGATNARFDDYLVKPCKLPLLLKILTEVASHQLH